MKRHICAAAGVVLLALAGAGTAAADGLPSVGQAATQSASFGDQTVGEQRNDADVTQAQGNGNLNISPAIALGGDAETNNAQGNGNDASADVDQSNEATQSQSAEQGQELDQSGSGSSCCHGQSQTGEQKADFGDQTVGEQENDADVEQYQGNGNVNVSPAIALGGDASTWNAQGNGNDASADVDQSNEATQSQDASQRQDIDQKGGCCGGQSQTGEQKADFGDQTVDKQKNDADVTQKQGNGNVNVSPAIAIFGDAGTKNAQGNGNTASADLDQSNEANQSQSAKQRQSHEQGGWDKGCCGGRSQTGEQKAYYGDQTVEKQKNDADVRQYQGNGNVNFSPAVAVGGDARTVNYQGNHNRADAEVSQSNTATQSQSADQRQSLSQPGGGCCKPRHGDAKRKACCDGRSQTGEQKADFGDQYVGKQKNEADVRQYQGNGNLNVSPALAFGGRKGDPCSKESYGRCGGSYGHGGSASTWNAQGNGNDARADVSQSNTATQSQSARQEQSLSQWGGGCCKDPHGWKPRKGHHPDHHHAHHGKDQCEGVMRR